MKKLKIIVPALALVFLAFLAAYSLTVSKSREARESFPVKGVDVSSYQGEIDWEELSGHDIQFAFIKATEGSSYKDRCFEKNIEEIKKTHLAAGAYHFLSFESDGKKQAENFIESVSPDSLDLPPVIDLELYGKYHAKPPKRAHVRRILDEMITRLYAAYGRYPIIYTNARVYKLYVAGAYKDCDIWLCDIIKKPNLPDGREWKFWQYSHTEKLSGYSGDEDCIDMNVFSGTENEFKKYRSF